MEKILLAIFALIISLQVNAATTTIGFDDYKGSGKIGEFYDGLTFVNARHTYLNLPGQDTPSGISYDGSSISSNPFISTVPIEIYFDKSIEYVSITGVGVGKNGFRFLAFNSSGDLIDHQEIWGKGSGDGEYFTLELFGLSISKVAFSQITEKTGDGIVFDNLKYGTLSEVPLPSALLLFAPALLGFMGLRRKAKLVV